MKSKQLFWTLLYFIFSNNFDQREDNSGVDRIMAWKWRINITQFNVT